VTVQDDERERELVRIFNLEWDPHHQRGGVDAMLKIKVNGQSRHLQVEVKSTTGNTVSTARDVGMEHIEKWRNKLFVIGFYSKEARRPELQRCLCLTPLDMEPWIKSIEVKIAIDFKLAQLASRKFDLADLHLLCGVKSAYSIEDARRLHKMQWSAQQYADSQDILVKGAKRISPGNMLEILRLRATYIAQRGATLNNPHVTKTHLQAFAGSSREIRASNWAVSIREIAKQFAIDFPNHPAILR
jgi:hypothetical protein